MRDDHWPTGAIAAEFDDERQFVEAVKAVSEQGYSRLDAYTPYPIPEIEHVVHASRSPLPVLAFVAGVLGAIAGYWIQWFANVVSYPLNIGGRPAHATPAFLIPTFEATVLFAATAVFVGLFAVLRLPRPWHPMFEVAEFERTSIDRFWIAIGVDERTDISRTQRALEQLRPRRVVRVPGDA